MLCFRCCPSVRVSLWCVDSCVSMLHSGVVLLRFLLCPGVVSCVSVSCFDDVPHVSGVMYGCRLWFLGVACGCSVSVGVACCCSVSVSDLREAEVEDISVKFAQCSGEAVPAQVLAAELAEEQTACSDRLLAAMM